MFAHTHLLPPPAQELKGNIRVFCRVRPPANHELTDGGASGVATDFPTSGEGRVTGDTPGDKGAAVLVAAGACRPQPAAAVFALPLQTASHAAEVK
jgi:hypothetical protein